VRSGSGPDELDRVIADIAAGAARLDAAPTFPASAFAGLGRAGALAGDAPYARQLELVRTVAAADGSVGRILDGHLNAAERLRMLGPTDDPAVARDLAAIAAGQLWLGLWGADPVGHEGPPASVVGSPGDWRLSGVKVFCSGAGGVHRAAVIARPPSGDGARWLVYVDVAGVEVDRRWFRGGGMRASESHRVRFDDTPVLAMLGEPGELGREPWFSRDAIRTAASWAGMADAAVAGALEALAARPQPGDLEGLAAGRMLTAQRTIDLWLAHAATSSDDAGMPALSIHLRDAVDRAATAILDEAARACGSRPFATGAGLDRARRDLELLLLQHRLDPLVARRGLAALGAGR
jgi:alkylation response protein AidB-like acyl-CoA dehydrogenase